jgi:hypothetical protein
LLKVLKPLLSGSNSTSLTSIALTSTTPAGVIASGIANNSTSKTDISINPYKLNKLNAGKPGFTKDKEIIIRILERAIKKAKYIASNSSSQLDCKLALILKSFLAKTLLRIQLTRI